MLDLIDAQGILLRPFEACCDFLDGVFEMEALNQRAVFLGLILVLLPASAPAYPGTAPAGCQDLIGAFAAQRTIEAGDDHPDRGDDWGGQQSAEGAEQLRANDQGEN